MAQLGTFGKGRAAGQAGSARPPFSASAVSASPPALTRNGRDLGNALACLEIGEDEGPLLAHLAGIALHHLEAGADERGQVDLVDDEKVRAGDAGPALARDLVARGHVDDVDREVGELGAEGGGEIVAARFDEDEVERGKARVELGHGCQIDRGVLADRRVRTAARLHAHDALGRKRSGAREELGVLLGVDVVGDDGEAITRAHVLAKPVDKRRLAGADRAADADAQGSVRRAGHERNSLEYWVS